MAGVAVVTGAGRGFGREISRLLAARGYTVLATDVDEAAAADTAEAIGRGAWSAGLDVRDPAAHRAAAAAALERGPLEVWVNNAGVMRTEPVWEHADDTVSLTVEANVLGVIWGCRAAIDAMREGGGEERHIVNLGSLSSFGPVPGLAVYGATKHAVVGFTESLQGDLDAAGLDIRMHVFCPDGANTQLVRSNEDRPEAAIIWSGGGLLEPAAVAERVVGMLDSARLVETFPRHRGLLARASGIAPRGALKLAPAVRRYGERQRARG